eukprot:9088772-Pyramimonas_sp.AAC.1
MASSKFTPLEKGCIRGLVCQAPWTKVRAADHGYIMPDLLCPLRGKEQDTIFHRLGKCWHESCAELRRELLGDDFQHHPPAWSSLSKHDQ